MKTCCACKEARPLSDFHLDRPRGHQRECKDCTRARKGAWHKTDSGKRSSANTKLKARFGITQERYDEIHASQDGKCLICGATESYMGHKLAVDHCHHTGKVRGLLCKGCNVGMGALRDDPALLERAAAYLRERA